MSRSILERVFPSNTGPEYEPVENDELLGNTDDATNTSRQFTPEGHEEEGVLLKKQFSWHDYTVFLLLGVAMLWAWYSTLSQSLNALYLCHYISYEIEEE